MATVTVKVIQDGVPIEGARVVTIPPFGPFTTDANGEFSVTVGAAFEHLVNVKVTGTAPGGGEFALGTQIELKANETTVIEV